MRIIYVVASDHLFLVIKTSVAMPRFYHKKRCSVNSCSVETDTLLREISRLRTYLYIYKISRIKNHDFSHSRKKNQLVCSAVRKAAYLLYD